MLNRTAVTRPVFNMVRSAHIYYTYLVKHSDEGDEEGYTRKSKKKMVKKKIGGACQRYMKSTGLRAGDEMNRATWSRKMSLVILVAPGDRSYGKRKIIDYYKNT